MLFRSNKPIVDWLALNVVALGKLTLPKLMLPVPLPAPMFKFVTAPEKFIVVVMVLYKFCVSC